MQAFFATWFDTWPWWISGPLIGLLVPILLLGGRIFGVSESLRHICSAGLPGSCECL